MSNLNGYIKLHRKLIDWEWYSDIKVSRVFIHLLLLANFKDTNWRGQGIKRGQLITSYPSLSTALKLSTQELRTVFKKLKSTNDINSKPTGKNILVTLVKFDSYQSKESDEQHDSNRESTALQHDSNTIATGNQQQRKNVKKDKKVKNDKKKEKDILEKVSIPNVFTKELIEAFREHLKMRAELKNPFKSDTSLQTKINSLGKDIERYGEEAVLVTIQRSIENQWIGIKVNWGKSEQEVKPIAPEYTPPYTIPTFDTADERNTFFYIRIVKYNELGHLNEGLFNTKYRKRGRYDKDAEALCYELEQANPKLGIIELNYTIR